MNRRELILAAAIMPAAIHLPTSEATARSKAAQPRLTLRAPSGGIVMAFGEDARLVIFDGELRSS